MSTKIQKLEVQAISFESEFNDVDTICEKWKTVPSADDKQGDELCRAGAREAQQLRKHISEKWGVVKKQVNAFKKQGDDMVKEMTGRLHDTEDSLRAEYRRVEEEKRRAKEEVERIERERVESLKQKLADLNSAGIVEYGTSTNTIEERISALRNIEIEKEDYREFYDECIHARDASLDRLESILESERQRIEKELQIAEERARIEEQQRIEREKIEAERAEQERIRIEQEEKLRAEREAFELERREREEYERAARELREAEERARIEEAERRIAEERRKVEEENKKLEAAREEQRRIEEHQQAEREAEERRLADEEQRRNNRLELLHTLNDMDAKNELRPETICDAIVDGMLPHVEYRG
jgi:hypothetical protein